tara:strand:+ start:929 stop:1327 length:399 start_codon:yes stop_codon:yes gene_type:complete
MSDNDFEKKGKEIVLDSGLTIIVHHEGKGGYPQYNERVEAEYTGFLEDGTVFDSTQNKNEPFKFLVGRGRVIKGWDEGFQKIKVGTKATFIIPPELGYGTNGAGGVIPPNATLFFQVELLNSKMYETKLGQK